MKRANRAFLPPTISPFHPARVASTAQPSCEKVSSLSVSSLLKLADVANIKQQSALQIIQQVKETVSNWLHFAKEAHVSTRSNAKHPVGTQEAF